MTNNWKEEFKKQIPKEVGVDTDFGYKLRAIGNKEVFTVTDWGRIEAFIESKFAELINEIKPGYIYKRDIQKLRDKYL